ncbi:MAG: hypothetical protein U0359_29385 [Byssovorax sp.]
MPLRNEATSTGKVAPIINVGTKTRAKASVKRTRVSANGAPASGLVSARERRWKGPKTTGRSA